jgi:hypothetical protein
MVEDDVVKPPGREMRGIEMRVRVEEGDLREGVLEVPGDRVGFHGR